MKSRWIKGGSDAKKYTGRMYKVRRCPTLNFPQFLESGTLFPGILEQGIFPHVLALPSTIICRSPSDLAIAEPQSCFGNQRQVFFASDSLEFSFQNSPLRFFEIWRTTMAIVVWLHNAHFCLICIQQKRFLRVQGGVSSEAKNPIFQIETIFQGVVHNVLYPLTYQMSITMYPITIDYLFNDKR